MGGEERRERSFKLKFLTNSLDIGNSKLHTDTLTVEALLSAYSKPDLTTPRVQIDLYNGGIGS